MSLLLLLLVVLLLLLVVLLVPRYSLTIYGEVMVRVRVRVRVIYCILHIAHYTYYTYLYINTHIQYTHIQYTYIQYTHTIHTYPIQHSPYFATDTQPSHRSFLSAHCDMTGVSDTSRSRMARRVTLKATTPTYGGGR